MTHVSDQRSFTLAWQAHEPVIVCGPGDYTLSVYQRPRLDGSVTRIVGGPDHRLTYRLNQTAGFEIEGFELTPWYGDAPAAMSSSRLTIRDCRMAGGGEGVLGIDGAVTGAPGLKFQTCSDVQIIGGTMDGVLHPLSFSDGERITVSGVQISRWQGDAIRLCGVEDVLIGRVSMVHPLGATNASVHADAIQIYAAAHVARPCRRVLIDRCQIITTGGGVSTQGIQVGNERPQDGLHEDITIRGCLVLIGHKNGIQMMGVSGGEVIDTMLVHDPSALAHISADRTATTSPHLVVRGEGTRVTASGLVGPTAVLDGAELQVA